MSVINTNTIEFVVNGEPISAPVLNRALNQTIAQINAYDFGSGTGEYVQGDGISITSNTIAVNGTVVRTSGAQEIAGSKTFTSPISAPSFAVSSDIRLKANVRPYTPKMSVSNIKLKEWKWVDSEYVPEHLRGTYDSGIIADEVELEFPTCVYVNQFGIKQVDYAKLAVHLILSRG